MLSSIKKIIVAFILSALAVSCTGDKHTPGEEVLRGDFLQWWTIYGPGVTMN